MNTTPDQNHDDITPQQEESLAERSARLEAEAAMGNFAELNPEEHGADNVHAEPEQNDATQALQAELLSAREQTLRALAEAENARKRAKQDREDASKYAITNFARDLLSVADNLRRGLDAITDDVKANEQMNNVVTGIEATERELLNTLSKNGVLKIDPMGKPFDPNFHEVMFEAPGTGQPAGTVVEVIETGYVIKDRLLRPARVGVAKDDGSTPPASGNAGLDVKA